MPDKIASLSAAPAVRAGRSAQQAGPAAASRRRIAVRTANSGTSSGRKLTPHAVVREARVDKQDLARLRTKDSGIKISRIDEFLGLVDTQTLIYLDKSTDRRVFQVREQKNNKLVRQVPSPEFLSRVRSMRRFIGKMVDRKA